MKKVQQSILEGTTYGENLRRQFIITKNALSKIVY
jgi:hypothetical protein